LTRVAVELELIERPFAISRLMMGPIGRGFAT
jgi:hypothetical protein